MYRPILISGMMLAATSAAIAGSPSIDGLLDAAAGYTNVTGTNAPAARTGFGASMDASEIWFTSDATTLYFFIQCKADTASNNGILFLLDTSAQTGDAAGSPLGGITGSGHALADTTNPNWKMEFEVDHAWVGNPGNTSTAFFVDEANYVGTNSGSFFGALSQSGTGVNGGGVTQAFNNGGAAGGLGASNGWEFAIDRASLGNITNAGSFTVFATVVSNTASFSDDSAPGTISTGNPGFNADFGTIAGTQSSGSLAVPVTLAAFSID